MNGQQPLPRRIVLSVLDEVVAAAKSAQTLVEDALLKLDTAAEVRHIADVDTRCLIDQIRSNRAGSLIMRVQKAKQFLLVDAVLLTDLRTGGHCLPDPVVQQGEILRADRSCKPVHRDGAPDVHSDMVRIYVWSYPVHRAHIARVPRMHVRHLCYPHAVEGRAVALLPHPLEGRLLYVVGEDLRRRVPACNYHT